MDNTTDYLAEAVTEAFGVRCRDSHEDCHCCRAWRQYDDNASLRSKLEEAEGALGPMVKKIDACNWYWPEHETDSESCCESAQEVVQNAYDWSHENTGDVVAVARGGVVEVTYCASLPPADDADSDDEFWVEEKTYEAAALKVADEQSRRTLASLREADHG